MSGNKKLYALCIGINSYPYVPKLAGCVPDATNMYNYLESTCANTDFEYAGVKLLNEQATKANIVQQFSAHLGKAGADDIAIFYFSGHGAEEDADEVFHNASTTKTLNTLVCYDSRSPEGVTDLADKELRYLIHELTYSADVNKKLPPFVLITDSCHSGSVTREADAAVMTARLTDKGNPRSWDKFIFKDVLSKKDFEKAKSLADILPQGQHIHFSSCQGEELAYEVAGSGVFTSSLLDVLKRTSGKVSYRDLYNRIRYYINGRFPQTPTIHVVDGSKDAMNDYFLGGASENKGVRVNVLFNIKERSWLMDMGALHGVPPIDPSSPVTLSILDGADKEVGTATVTAVMPDKSTLTVEGDLDIKEAYSATVKGIYSTPINVFVEGNGAAAIAIKAAAAKAADSLKDANVVFTDSLVSASYVVSEVNEKYVIRRPANNLPLVEQQSVNGAGAIDKVLGFLQSIARWEFTRGLDNPKTRLTGENSGQPAVSIEVYKVKDENDDSQDVLLTPSEDGRIAVDKSDILRIGIKNNTRNKKLYCSLMGMDALFGVNADMIMGKVDYVEADNSLWVFEKDPIYMEDAIEEYHTAYNWATVTWDLKLLVSTVRFDVSSLEQESLPQPASTSSEMVGMKAIKRRSTPDSEDWCTELVSLVIKL